MDTTILYHRTNHTGTTMPSKLSYYKCSPTTSTSVASLTPRALPATATGLTHPALGPGVAGTEEETGLIGVVVLASDSEVSRLFTSCSSSERGMLYIVSIILKKTLCFIYYA